jgi:hypothetical protein
MFLGSSLDFVKYLLGAGFMGWFEYGYGWDVD